MKIFSIQKVKIHNENMDFVGTKTRIKIFGKTVFSISYPIIINNLKVI